MGHTALWKLCRSLVGCCPVNMIPISRQGSSDGPVGDSPSMPLSQRDMKFPAVHRPPMHLAFPILMSHIAVIIYRRYLGSRWM